MTLMDFFETVYLRDRIDMTTGAVQYRTAIRQLNKALFRQVQLDDLCDELLVSHMRWLRDDRGLAPRTVNSRRQILLTLWRHAHRKRLVMEGPRDVPRLREPRRIPEAWTPAQVGEILSACERARTLTDERGTPVWTPAHWRALILVMYDSAERIGALLQCKRTDVDVPKRTLHVRSTYRKCDDDHVVRLHPDTLEALDASFDRPRLLLFPWPRAVRRIWIHYERILEDAGLPTGRRDKFHRLRRTSYTQVYVVKGPVAASLQAGHKTDMSRYYLDRSQLPDLDAADVIERPA